MGETEGHLVGFLGLEALEEGADLGADATEKLGGGRAVNNVQAEFLLDGSAEGFVVDGDLGLNLTVDHVLLQELFQRFAKFAFDEIGGGVHGGFGVLEFGEGLEGHCFAGILGAFEMLGDHLGVIEKSGLVQFEPVKLKKEKIDNEILIK